MRSFIQFGVTVLCMGMVGAGLFLSIDAGDEGVVLERPNTPGRLVAENSSATAFFQIDGNALELTMLFAEAEEPDSVFRTRVRLMDGQSHSIIVSDADDGSDGQRYTFHRKGDKVEMILAPAGPLTASFAPSE